MPRLVHNAAILNTAAKTLVHKLPCAVLTWHPLDEYPGVVEQIPMEDLFLIFGETFILISIVTALAYVSSSNV